MEPFEQHTGIAAPLIQLNIDTDAIIPSREIKSVSKKVWKMVCLQNGDICLLKQEKKTQNLFLIKNHTGEHPSYSREKTLAADPLENTLFGLYTSGVFGLLLRQALVLFFTTIASKMGSFLFF